MTGARTFSTLNPTPTPPIPPGRRNVTGIDATGARTFSTLRNSLAVKGVQLMFSAVPESVRGMLSAHHIQMYQVPTATSTLRSGGAKGGGSGLTTHWIRIHWILTTRSSLNQKALKSKNPKKRSI